MNLTDYALCERCEHYTTDLTDCEHYQMCATCRDEDGCRFCRSDVRIGRLIA